MTRAVSGSHLAAPAPSVPHFHAKFDGMAQAVARGAATLTAAAKTQPIFRVAPRGDLFELYLHSFKPEDRQYHNCNCCRAFVHRFGNLAVLDPAGKLVSVMWDPSVLAPRDPYRKAIAAMELAVEQGAITDQFFWDETDWGAPEQGGFTHFYAKVARSPHPAGKDASAWMGEKREDRRHLPRALADLDRRSLEQTRDMLLHGGLSRAEKLSPMVDFLLMVHKAVDGVGVRGEARNRALWGAVGIAPPGWCTPRSSALGALVDDVKAGLSAANVKRKHDERMDPLKYQRPTAAPRAGNVATAERTFERLGLAASLKRRPARADEVVLEWKPQWKGVRPGLFGHLLEHERGPASARLLGTQAQPITYARFRRDVLPHAISMEVVVPGQGEFIAVTTAVERDAPPILQWDREECRNPFAWYVYAGGSPASNWGLRPGRAPVVGITLQPSQWGQPLDRPGHHGSSAILMIEGARDSRSSTLALFPECLRSELHEVRSTVEAHSRRTAMQPLPVGTQHASGLRVSDRGGAEVWVRTGTGVFRYRLDRME
jgi:hypothetical protein